MEVGVSGRKSWRREKRVSGIEKGRDNQSREMGKQCLGRYMERA